MRHIERLLIAFNVTGSVVAGIRHDPIWFAIAAAAFFVYVLVQDRVLRRRIGDRAWPSEGFARFTFNTNLYFGLRHVVLGAVLYAVAGNAASLMGY